MDLVSAKDEFQVALVKICIACLDATNFVGLANEVAYVRGGGTLARITRLISEGGAESRRAHSTSVKLGQSEVVIRQPEYSTARRRRNGRRSRSATPAPFLSQVAKNPSGLAREIKHVAPLQNGREAGVVPGVGGYWLDAFHRPEVRRLIRSIFAFCQGLWMWIVSLVRHRRRPLRRSDQASSGVGDGDTEDEINLNGKSIGISFEVN